MRWLDTRTAYRRGLCTDCQQVAPEAGMPRCWTCHRVYTGAHLTPEQRRQWAIRDLAGPHPSPAVFVLAVFLADLIWHLKRTQPKGQAS